MKPRYINLFTDFGFKKIFGEEASKTILIDFLNSLLPADAHIRDLTFKNTEQLGSIPADRKAVYDIYCENDKGEKFIVELQKAKQNFFKERTVYYTTFPIWEMAEKGTDWAFDLKAVYCIGVLDFVFNDYATAAEALEVIHEIKLRKPDGKVFYDKLTYIYLEMPNFEKTEAQLQSRLDKWLYFIKHLEDFQSIPSIFQHEVVFLEAFEKAAVANLSEQEQAGYEYSKKVYRDMKGVIDSAWVNGREEGIAEGIALGREEGIAEEQARSHKKMLDIAQILKASGQSVDFIVSATGLTPE